MQENLKAKYGITDEELKRAVDQINLGKIACSGAALCAICDLITSGDIQPPKTQMQSGDKNSKIENRIAQLRDRAIEIVKELVPVVDELEDIVSAGNKLVGISDVGNAKTACDNAYSYLKQAICFLSWAKQDTEG